MTDKENLIASPHTLDEEDSTCSEENKYSLNGPSLSVDHEQENFKLISSSDEYDSSFYSQSMSHDATGSEICHSVASAANKSDFVEVFSPADNSKDTGTVPHNNMSFPDVGAGTSSDLKCALFSLGSDNSHSEVDESNVNVNRGSPDKDERNRTSPLRSSPSRGESPRSQPSAPSSPSPSRSVVKFDRTTSVPSESLAVRDDSNKGGGTSPRLASMKKRSQSAAYVLKRPLYGVSPHCKFGPKGYLCSPTTHHMSIPDPSDQRLNWTKPPLSVLIIRKHLDTSVLLPFRDLVIWLVEEKSMLVYIEMKVLDDDHLLDDKDFERVQHKLKTFREGVDDLTDKVDFIICLGGDGTLLYVSSLFQASVPPVMAFNMGSLGFLTPFQFSQDFKHEVNKVMQGSASLLLRYRLKCVVVKHDNCEGHSTNLPHVKNIQKEHKLLKTHKLVLNEVVLDRGPSSYLSNLDLYIEGRRVTTVQGDGLIISTPTGSTAYAVSAGASMIHPSVPCILLTPICPHSLSFRPIVVPAGVEIKVMLNPNSRGTAMVSFDGRDRQEIAQGDSLRITTAAYPVPSICGADQIEDWFEGLAVCLNWNIRAQQRPLLFNDSFTSIESLDSASDAPTMTSNTSRGSQLQQSLGKSTQDAEDRNCSNNSSNGNGPSNMVKRGSGSRPGGRNMDAKGSSRKGSNQ